MAKAKRLAEKATKSGTVTAQPRQTLSREAWIAAARKVLEKGGIAEVKIDGLARQLKVTRGSFYFHFSSLEDLHNGLLEQWRRDNCRPFQDMRDAAEIDGLQFFTAIVHVWVDEDPFSPLLDLAVRDWSRTSKKLAREVAEMDSLRISLLTRAFRALGYSRGRKPCPRPDNVLPPDRILHALLQGGCGRAPSLSATLRKSAARTARRRAAGRRKRRVITPVELRSGQASACGRRH